MATNQPQGTADPRTSKDKEKDRKRAPNRQAIDMNPMAAQRYSDDRKVQLYENALQRAKDVLGLDDEDAVDYARAQVREFCELGMTVKQKTPKKNRMDSVKESPGEP